MRDLTILPPTVRAALRQRLDLHADDPHRAATLSTLRAEAAFVEFCRWRGLATTWAATLRTAMRACIAAALAVPDPTAAQRGDR